MTQVEGYSQFQKFFSIIAACNCPYGAHASSILMYILVLPAKIDVVILQAHLRQAPFRRCGRTSPNSMLVGLIWQRPGALLVLHSPLLRCCIRFLWLNLIHCFVNLTNLQAAQAETSARAQIPNALPCSAAQVIGAPVASGLLLTDGFLHLRGWQWLFLLEGLPTVCLGVWVSRMLHLLHTACCSSIALLRPSVFFSQKQLNFHMRLFLNSVDHSRGQQVATYFCSVQIWLTLAPTPLGAKFLSAAEQDAVHQQVKSNRVRPHNCMLAVAVHRTTSLINTACCIYFSTSLPLFTVSLILQTSI